MVGTPQQHCQWKGTQREDFSVPCLEDRCFAGQSSYGRRVTWWVEGVASGEVRARLGIQGDGKKEQRQNLKGERGPLVLALLSIKCLSQVRVWANCCAETIRELTGLSPALQKPGTKDRPSNPPELQPRWEAAFLPLGKVTRVQAVAPSPMGRESPPFPLSVETWSPLWLPLQA